MGIAGNGGSLPFCLVPAHGAGNQACLFRVDFKLAAYVFVRVPASSIPNLASATPSRTGSLMPGRAEAMTDAVAGTSGEMG